MNGLVYRGTWLMADDANTVPIVVDIFDTDVQITEGTPEVIDLQMGQNPLVISVIDNDKDKYTPIKSKQAVIEIKTENGIDLMTFTGSADNRFYVEIYNGDGTFLFKGFLVTADLSQPYLPNKQTLVLTASDCLGLLKDVPLTDVDGDNPTGKNKIIKYLAWALLKTGLSLFIKVINNLRHGTGNRTVGVVNFSSASDTIFFPAEIVDMFYEGQEVEVTAGSVLNLGTTFTVLTVNGGANIEVSPTPVHESGALNVVFEDVSSRPHFYEGTYLDAKTFESEIGECENCYQVLEKILGNDCYLTQYKGEWWIVRLDEFDENDIYVSVFESDGTFDSNNAPEVFNIEIGETEPFRFALADQLLERERPIGSAKLTYNYNFPLEVPCNKDFARGDLIDGSDPARKKYELDCWTQHQENYPTSGLIAATTDIYVIKEYNGIDYETARYVVIEAHTPSSNLIKSSPIEVQVKDKIAVTMSRRLNSDVSGSGFYRDNGMQVRLIGDDGTYWTLQGETSTGDELEWVESDADFLTFNKYLWFEGDVSRDMTETESLYGNTESPAVPVSGTIYLLAHQTHQSSWNRDTYIEEVGFTYIPYINGSYQRYSGQSQKVTRSTTGYLAKKDDEVFISDSPKKLFKGALFILVDGAYVLTTKFYPANVFPTYNPPGDACHPYGEVQIRSVYNQYRNANTVFTGTIKGLATTWPDLINKFSLTDSHPAANDRYFILTGCSQDWKTGLMSATLIECFDRINGHLYSEAREFKYIAQ